MQLYTLQNLQYKEIWLHILRYEPKIPYLEYDARLNGKNVAHRFWRSLAPSVRASVCRCCWRTLRSCCDFASTRCSLEAGSARHDITWYEVRCHTNIRLKSWEFTKKQCWYSVRVRTVACLRLSQGKVKRTSEPDARPMVVTSSSLMYLGRSSLRATASRCERSFFSVSIP